MYFFRIIIILITCISFFAISSHSWQTTQDEISPTKTEVDISFLGVKIGDTLSSVESSIKEKIKKYNINYKICKSILNKEEYVCGIDVRNKDNDNDTIEVFFTDKFAGNRAFSLSRSLAPQKNESLDFEKTINDLKVKLGAPSKGGGDNIYFRADWFFDKSGLITDKDSNSSCNNVDYNKNSCLGKRVHASAFSKEGGLLWSIGIQVYDFDFAISSENIVKNKIELISKEVDKKREQDIKKQQEDASKNRITF